MTISFDAATQRINLSAGTTALDVRDLYSRWKDWVQVSDNTKYLPAFSVTGGDTIDAGAGTSIPCYAFLLNGWRVKPQEASHTLGVSGGVLLVSGGGDPFVNTMGSFIVRINYSQPVQAVTVSTGGGSGTAPTADQVADAVRAELAVELARLLDLAKINGLVTGTSAVVTATSRTAGDVSQTISEASGVVTVSRA